MIANYRTHYGETSIDAHNSFAIESVDEKSCDKLCGSWFSDSIRKRKAVNTEYQQVNNFLQQYAWGFGEKPLIYKFQSQ